MHWIKAKKKNIQTLDRRKEGKRNRKREIMKILLPTEKGFRISVEKRHRGGDEVAP